MFLTWMYLTTWKKTWNQLAILYFVFSATTANMGPWIWNWKIEEFYMKVEERISTSSNSFKNYFDNTVQLQQTGNRFRRQTNKLKANFSTYIIREIFAKNSISPHLTICQIKCIVYISMYMKIMMLANVVCLKDT